MLNFLTKHVCKMQLYLRPFYNILRQQNSFEWTTDNQLRFEEIKKFLTEQISNTIPDPDQPFYAMCDASNFGIVAALLQSHSGINKMNLISAKSRLITQAELKLSTLMRECTASVYTLRKYDFSRKTTVEIPQKNFLAKDKTSSRLECKTAVKTNIDQSQINSLQHFPLYLDCQNNHYEVDLLDKSSFKPIPYSNWTKNNTQQKQIRQQPPRKDLFPFVEKENLTHIIIYQTH